MMWVCNIKGVKVIELPFTPDALLPLSLLLYPLLFALSCLMGEIFGGGKTRTVIYLGLGMGLLILPFNTASWALIGSLGAYAVSLMLNIRLFGFLKGLTRSRHLWFRYLGAAFIAQIVDTLAVNVLLLYCGLQLDLAFVMGICLLCYLYKVAFTIVLLPLIYGATEASRRYLA